MVLSMALVAAGCGKSADSDTTTATTAETTTVLNNNNNNNNNNNSNDTGAQEGPTNKTYGDNQGDNYAVDIFTNAAEENKNDGETVKKANGKTDTKNKSGSGSNNSKKNKKNKK